MNLVPGFIGLLQALAPTMTTPTFESFVTVVTGWVFSGRGTITRSILSAGGLATKHFSSYHRLFSAARWSLDAVGLAVFDLIEPWLGNVIMLGVDDTLARSLRKRSTSRLLRSLEISIKYQPYRAAVIMEILKRRVEAGQRMLAFGG